MHLKTVLGTLEQQHGLSLNKIEQALGNLCSGQIDYGDIYFQHQTLQSVVLEEGIIKEGSFDITQGFGVRAVVGECASLAHSSDLTLEQLINASNIAKSIAKTGQTKPVALKEIAAKSYFTAKSPVDATLADKIDWLRTADALARRKAPEVTEVIASITTCYDEVLVAATDGTLGADIRPMLRININVIAQKDGQKESATAGAGGRITFDDLFKKRSLESLVDEAIRLVRVNLAAKAAPAGMFPTVLGSGWPGVLLHEAVGHGLEADFNRRGSSTFSGRIGEQVASTLCTVVDDGTIEHARGSLAIDDEGTPTARNVLIENGILKNYMQDKLNARLMNMPATGNGRRESYAYAVMPRMTNTFMLPGEHSPEEIISTLDKGVYAANFGGGSVDITSGQFVFSASEAYWVENGKIQYPIKGATLIGNGPEVMQKIEMVGNDLNLDPGIGTCGKSGQNVPVGVGQPTLKIRDITIGGTAA